MELYVAQKPTCFVIVLQKAAAAIGYSHGNTMATVLRWST